MSEHGKDAVRLCEHIVRGAFGDVVCRVASVLLNRGRLPLPMIQRLSGIPRRTCISALLLLLQHNLVLSTGAQARYLAEQDPSASSSERDLLPEEHYDFDVRECLLRLRWGRILAFTEHKMGQKAMELVRVFMVYGRLKVGDMNRVMGVEGDARGMAEVEDTMLALVRGSYLEVTCPELQTLESEFVARRFAVLKRAKQKELGQSLLSANDITNAQLQAVHDVQEDRERMRNLDKVLIEMPRVNKKKKKGEDEFEYSLRPTATLKINNDRYSVMFRDEMIIEAAGDRWNKGAAVVVRAVLESALDKESTITDMRTHKHVGFNEIMERIPKSQHAVLAAGIYRAEDRSPSEVIGQYLLIAAGEDQLIADSGAFLRREGGSSSPRYTVELESVCVRMRTALLDQLVRERLGDKAARVLAVVVKAQKATEHTVRDCAMISLKDARKTLADLQKLSVVELQEVPKTGAKLRTGLPSSAEYHLWQVDLARVHNTLLAAVYKSIGNLLQRQAAEVEKRTIVLEREEKSASVGHGRERLQQKDQDELAELDEYRKKLMLAMTRSDMVAFVLRDLPGVKTK